MLFPQDFIEKVRSSSNLVEIVSQYTELKGGGGRLMGRCPYPDHSDKSPSFSVDANRQLFHCFGCKKGGDVFHFVETYNSLSFSEAVEYLARRASLSLPEPGPEDFKKKEKRADKEMALKLNRVAAVHWHRALKSEALEDVGRSYLSSRGISEEIIDLFRLGVAGGEWDTLAKHFLIKKAPLPLADSLGLVRKRKAPAEGYFDLFRSRIMFPIFSPVGEVIGFGGRTYSDGTPKYLNSPESTLFSKGKTLYGLHETGKFIRAQDEAVVVEGYMDALSLYAAGIKNVVAILGTALTAEHAKVLLRYTGRVVVLLDGDSAGMSAAARSLPVLLDAGLIAKGCFLPDSLDPDDFVRQRGAAELREQLQRAPELFNLIFAQKMVGYSGSSAEKVRLVEEMAVVFRSIHKPELLDLYLQEVSRRLDVTLPWLRKAVLSQQNTRPAGSETKAWSSKKAVINADPIENNLTEQPRALVSLLGAPRDEAFVLSLGLQNERLFESLMEPSLREAITHPGVQRLLDLAMERHRQSPKDFVSLASWLASQTDRPELLTSASVPNAAATPFSGSASGATLEVSEDDRLAVLERLLSDYKTAIRKRHFKNQAKDLVNQLRDGTEQNELPEKLERIMNLIKNRHSLDREN